jgi:hypothetical protein
MKVPIEDTFPDIQELELLVEEDWLANHLFLPM